MKQKNKLIDFSKPIEEELRRLSKEDNSKKKRYAIAYGDDGFFGHLVHEEYMGIILFSLDVLHYILGYLDSHKQEAITSMSL